MTSRSFKEDFAMPANSLRPLPSNEFDHWKAQHLLNRACFGGTPGQIRALAQMGLKGAVDYIVDFEKLQENPVNADDFDKEIISPGTLEERMEERRARQTGDEAALERFQRERNQRMAADRRQLRELQIWWLKRMIESARPLEEKMTLFWHGHFAAGYRTVQDSYHMFLQNQLFRLHAVGNFKSLTHGIIRDPAMLRFLNNNQNLKASPNENLARELMELFTMGEGNGYTEEDIKQGARALTGYTYRDDEPVGSDTRFFEQVHDDGPKKIFGRIGNFDGDDFIDLIFTNKVVSQYICLKLYRFFVNDVPGEPSEDVQDFIVKLADRFREENYQLKPVLKALFTSENFYDPENTAALVKSPVQLVVQSIRSLRTPSRNLNSLMEALGLMGQTIFAPPSVKGWDGGRTWINTSTMFARQNVLVALLTGRRAQGYAWEADGTPYDAMHLVEHLRGESGAVDANNAVSYLLRFVLGREPHEARVSTLVAFVKANGGRIDNNMLIALLSLITAMPEYQLC
jgi:uncharacterized protein (DUF1800 family)